MEQSDLFKVNNGFTITVIESPFVEECKPVLTMHPNDFKRYKESFDNKNKIKDE